MTIQDQKYKHIKLALIGVAAVQLALIIYHGMGVFNLLAMEANIQSEFTGTISPINPWLMLPVFSVFSLVFTIITIKEFKPDDLKSWIMANIVFIISAPGFALPFSMWGLIVIWCKSIREKHLTQLLIQL